MFNNQQNKGIPFEKGHIPWNKGKVDIYSKETLENWSKTRKGRVSPNKGNHLSEEARNKLSKLLKGQIPWNKNIPCSKETKKKLSDNHKGQIPWNKGKKGLQKSWNKGKTGIYSEDTRRKMSEAAKGKPGYWTGKTLSSEHIKNVLRRRIPTSLEEKFQGIIDKNNLPYKFVGDGSFIVAHCNPDFINVNGKKIAIEVYANYHKLKNWDSIEKWKTERTSVFAEYGWKVIFFDEVQVNEKFVLSELGG